MIPKLKILLIFERFETHFWLGISVRFCCRGTRPPEQQTVKNHEDLMVFTVPTAWGHFCEPRGKHEILDRRRTKKS